MTFDVGQTFDPPRLPRATTLTGAPRVALYQPDIPQNTGTILRLAACLGFAVDLVEPAGFRLDDKALIRAGLDYRDRAALTRHADFDRFDAARRASGRRLVLVETGAQTRHIDFAFAAADTLLFGRESAGTPPAVVACADAVITIPMLPDRRSINLALACAMVVAEAYRQLDIFPVQ
jgi:tRNA (cytidine/uridine-2'-O-)-methyltransferase